MALTPAQRLTAVLVTDEALAAELTTSGTDLERAYDGERAPGFPAGTVTACGTRAVSSTKDAKQVRAHVRAWVVNGVVLTQEVHVLPRQRAEDVVAKAASTLKGCASYADHGDGYRRTASNKIKLPEPVRGAAACFTVAGSVNCHAYLGRAGVVTTVSSMGPDQKTAEWWLDRIMTAAEHRLEKLPA
ncbi:hypothetical protein [Catellatospora methionotrophica]|uniref:hypothetical protein n=1 Tax=Catellatospora methionotrophica TaxID=121620 RepID=UPI00140E0F83|nr:hypothetical protein [Catellatospora methionotrophica]